MVTASDAMSPVGVKIPTSEVVNLRLRKRPLVRVVPTSDQHPPIGQQRRRVSLPSDAHRPGRGEGFGGGIIDFGAR